MARLGQEDRESNDHEKQALDTFSEKIEPSFIKAMNDDFNTAGAIGHLFAAVPVVNEILNRAEKGSQERVSKAFFNEIDLFFKNVGSILGLFESGVKWGHDFLGIKLAVSDSVSLEESLNITVERYVVPKEVNELVEERENARKEKDWALADELRDKIAELGFTIQDTPQGAMAVPIK
jgi:cysteinyl-tRNA synthetase